MSQLPWSRRAVLQAGAVAGGVTLLSAMMGTAQHALAATSGSAAKPEVESSGPSAALQTDEVLQGICDIHVHAAPDTKARSIDELNFARDAQRAGYRAVMFKSNDWSCHDRAWLVQQAFPDFTCFGSLCMNRVHGERVNVYAAEQAVATTGGLCRCIWMPTLHAAWQHSHEKRPGKGIPVLDTGGKVLPEVVRVMEICAEANIIFATGHSSPAESLVLARMAHEVGVKKFVVTHANSLIWKMSRAQIMQVADLGGYIEFCYITNLWGPGTGLPQYSRASSKEFTDYVQIVPERSYISTDLGQVGMPHPVDGMRLCIADLRRAGLSATAMDVMLRTNPAHLLGIS